MKFHQNGFPKLNKMEPTNPGCVFVYLVFFPTEALENDDFQVPNLHLQILQNPWKSKTKQSGWSLGFFLYKGFPILPMGKVWSPRPLPREMFPTFWRVIFGGPLPREIIGKIGAPEPSLVSSRMISS